MIFEYTTFVSRPGAGYDGFIVVTDSDGRSSSHDGLPVTDMASGSRSLCFRQKQASLSNRLTTVDRLTVVYECMAAQLDAASATFRQAAIATATQFAAATLEEHRDSRIKPLVPQLCALRKQVETVDARLTVMETRWNDSRSDLRRLRRGFMEKHAPIRRSIHTPRSSRRRPSVRHRPPLHT